MNQKGISAILIILIIVGVLVVAGGVWYWQNQIKQFSIDDNIKETTNWETYRNEKYGFEFKYPIWWKENRWAKIIWGEDAGEEGLGGKWGLCLDEFICPHITFFEFELLPTKVETEMPEILTREQFIELKDDIENNRMEGELERYEITKLNGKNAAYDFYFDVPSATHLINTLIFLSDNVLARISLNLPIPIITKDGQRIDHLELQEKMERGIFPNEEVRKIFQEYQTMLSTFRFLE